MRYESPQAELARLGKEQTKARQDEVFGGLSPAERAEYDGNAKRINELEIEIRASATAIRISRSAKAEQKRQWNKASETDTPQGEAHQPYRSRETESASTNSRLQRRKAKKAPDEKASE